MMSSQDLITLLTCPLSYQLFLEPVFVDSGIVYEKDMILTHLKISNICPITRQHISSNIKDALLIKQIINKLIENNTELKNEQFKKILKHVDELIEISMNPDKLYNYNIINIHILLNNNTLLKQMLKKNIVNFKYIIDNCDNLEYETAQKCKLIHLVCNHGTPEIIKYLIDKNVNLESETIEKWKPIHYICRYSTPEMIYYIIDKNVDLECETNEKWKPIHFLCRYSTFDTIVYLKSKNVLCNTKIKERYTPYDCLHANENNIREKFNNDLTLK